MNDYWPDSVPTNVHFDMHDIHSLIYEDEDLFKKKGTKMLLGGMTEDFFILLSYSAI